MNAVITYSRYGGPDVLSLSDADIPEPGPGQVRIRVRAVAVNPIDAKIRSGRMDGIFPIQFPVLPGWDVAGVVDVAGPGAAAAAGDEVFGVAAVGGYSQYALLDRPVPKPAALSWETAAALVTVGEAAFRVLKHLGLKAGQTLVILGAGGSVGTIAVQLATARGIRVIGTAADGDLGRLTGLGATAVRYGDGWTERVRAAAPGGVDAVFDTTGPACSPARSAWPETGRASSPSPTTTPRTTASSSPARTRRTARRSPCRNWPPWRPAAGSPFRCGGPTRSRRPRRPTPTWTRAATTASSCCSPDRVVRRPFPAG